MAPGTTTPTLEVLASVRRSAVRRRALLGLARLGRAYPAAIARESGLALRQVRLALRGNPPDYREPLALANVGLARAARYVGGRYEYEITPLGAIVARAVEDGLIGDATEIVPAELADAAQPEGR